MALVSNNMNKLMFPESRSNYSSFDDLSERIAKKYKNRLIESTDPIPIMIKCDTTGPLTVTKGSVMCDSCGSIIRRNYLTNHRNSGACSRLTEKREQQILKDNPPSTYIGPIIKLTNNSSNS